MKINEGSGGFEEWGALSESKSASGEGDGTQNWLQKGCWVAQRFCYRKVDLSGNCRRTEIDGEMENNLPS